MSQFQSAVTINPAIGVAGDKWGTNPRATVLAGEGQLVAGPDGLYVGRFAWKHSDGLLYNTGTGAPTGFVGREQQALITEFLAETSMLIPPGQGVTLFSAGDFLMKNEGDEAATENATLYVDSATGSGAPGSTGTAMAAAFTGSVAANVVASTGSISTNTCTASIADTTMTVTAIVTGALAPGQTITGTGVAAGTTIVSQLTGATTGSTGTYEVSIDQTVASTTITGSGGCLTVVSMTSGTVVVGQSLTSSSAIAGSTVLARVTGTGAAGKYWVSVADTISSEAITLGGGTLTVTAVASGTILPNEVFAGSNVTSGSYIISNITGSGGTGTYYVSVGDTASSTSMTIAGSVSTKWLIRNAAGVGELMKISSYALG